MSEQHVNTAAEVARVQSGMNPGADVSGSNVVASGAMAIAPAGLGVSESGYAQFTRQGGGVFNAAAFSKQGGKGI